MSLLRTLENEAAEVLRADSRLGLFPVRVYTREREQAVPWDQLPHGLILLAPAFYLVDREQPMPVSVIVQFSVLAFLRRPFPLPGSPAAPEGASALAERTVAVLHGAAHTQGDVFRAERLALQPVGRADAPGVWDEAYPRGWHRRLWLPPAGRFLEACLAHFWTTATLALEA